MDLMREATRCVCMVEGGRGWIIREAERVCSYVLGKVEYIRRKKERKRERGGEKTPSQTRRNIRTPITFLSCLRRWEKEEEKIKEIKKLQ